MTPLEELQHVLYGQLHYGNDTSELECILAALREAKALGYEEGKKDAECQKQQLAQATQQLDAMTLAVLDAGCPPGESGSDFVIRQAQQLATARSRILELEQALRLHLAVDPNDPILIIPKEAQL